MSDSPNLDARIAQERPAANRSGASPHTVPDWVSGRHGHVIPVRGGIRRVRCGGTRYCGTCQEEQRLVQVAARREDNGVDACGGPGTCRECRRTLVATGVNLTRYEWPDAPELGSEPSHPQADGRYTLDQARRELARRECQNHGHDWTLHTVTQFGRRGDRPHSVDCSRPCGHPPYAVVALTAEDLRDA